MTVLSLPCDRWLRKVAILPNCTMLCRVLTTLVFDPSDINEPARNAVASSLPVTVAKNLGGSASTESRAHNVFSVHFRGEYTVVLCRTCPDNVFSAPRTTGIALVNTDPPWQRPSHSPVRLLLRSGWQGRPSVWPWTNRREACRANMFAVSGPSGPLEPRVLGCPSFVKHSSKAGTMGANGMSS